MDPIVVRVRAFNRFYTEQIGVLDEHLLDSDYSLTEVRVLYEINQHSGATAAGIGAELGLDRGYLSRILQRFARQGLVMRKAAPNDARVSLLSLSAKGRRVFGALDTRANEQVATLLRTSSPNERERLLQAMRTIQEVLAASRDAEQRVILREPRSGDLGWIVFRHGVLYAQEYRYDERFEALVAKIVGEFVEQFDAQRERCWVAEQNGDVVGSVFLVRGTDAIAKLRLLYVEPSARGHGIGERLIVECVRFARAAGYEKITLWTQSELLAARRLYEKAGFTCVKQEAHSSFGRDDLVAETWDLEL
jgi:DNA-binding MarR family transcriptional regulator/GNAT superfamily N-acetyltransferase